MRNDFSPESPRFECLFCCHWFEELPWYGCCGGCYAGSAEIRSHVDAAQPPTWPSAVFDIGGARVPQDAIDEVLDAEFAREMAS